MNKIPLALTCILLFCQAATAAVVKLNLAGTITSIAPQNTMFPGAKVGDLVSFQLELDPETQRHFYTLTGNVSGTAFTGAMVPFRAFSQQHAISSGGFFSRGEGGITLADPNRQVIFPGDNLPTDLSIYSKLTSGRLEISHAGLPPGQSPPIVDADIRFDATITIPEPTSTFLALTAVGVGAMRRRRNA